MPRIQLYLPVYMIDLRKALISYFVTLSCTVWILETLCTVRRYKDFLSSFWDFARRLGWWRSRLFSRFIIKFDSITFTFTPSANDLFNWPSFKSGGKLNYQGERVGKRGNRVFVGRQLDLFAGNAAWTYETISVQCVPPNCLQHAR